MPGRRSCKKKSVIKLHEARLRKMTSAPEKPKRRVNSEKMIEMPTEIKKRTVPRRERANETIVLRIRDQRRFVVEKLLQSSRCSFFLFLI